MPFWRINTYAADSMPPGTDIKGGMVAPHSTLSKTLEEHTSFYFNTYSRDCLVQVTLMD